MMLHSKVDMRLPFGISFLLLYTIVPLWGSNGYQVQTVLQTPFVVDAPAGHVVTSSFLIQNTTDKELDLFTRLLLPPEWEAIPTNRPIITLAPQASYPLLVALRIPPGYPAGRHPITLIVQGEQDPSAISTCKMWVHVLPQPQINSRLVVVPRLAYAGEVYTVDLEVENTGNVPVKALLHTREYLHYCITCHPTEISLAPREIQTMRITVNTDPALVDLTKHHLQITLSSPDHIFTDEYHSTTVEVFPTHRKPQLSYCSFPMTTTLGYGRKNEKTQSFVEVEGHKSFANTQTFDFYARIPIQKQAPILQDFGGFPGTGYVHYENQWTDIYGGDGLYYLTPLTLLNLFGRGGSLMINHSPWSGGALYVQDIYSCSSTEMGGYIGFQPLSYSQLTASYLHVRLPEKTAETRLLPRLSHLYSLLAQLEKPSVASLEAEYATNGDPLTSTSADRACFLNVWWRPYKDASYALQLIQAGDKFTGYYKDQLQRNASISMPIIGDLRACGSLNYIATNLEKNPEKCSANRNLYEWAGLTYTFPKGLYASLGYNLAQSRDLLQDTSYSSHYLSLLLSRCGQSWTVQGQLAEGRYTNTWPPHSLIKHHWQNYQAYLYYYPLACLYLSLYTRLGTTSFAQKIQWTNTYGGGFSWHIYSRMWLQCNNEYTHYQSAQFSNFLTTTVVYNLPKQHTLEGRGFWRHNVQGEDIYEFLLLYTVPWKLPLRKEKKYGSIQGKVFAQEKAEIRPLAHMVVNCNGNRAMTDLHGEFSFTDINPGTYTLWVDPGTQPFISSKGHLNRTTVQGGTISQVSLPFIAPATIKGEISLYRAETLTQLEKTSEPQIVYSKAKGWPHAIIRLFSPEHQLLLECKTNNQGVFSIEKIIPGIWKLKVLVPDLPAAHRVSLQEVEIELLPNQEKIYEIKILPIITPHRSIDQGTLS